LQSRREIVFITGKKTLFDDYQTTILSVSCLQGKDTVSNRGMEFALKTTTQNGRFIY
jgi:hypothetical protein